MKAHLVPFAMSAFTGLFAVSTACSDDSGQGGDTIDDTSEVVDTSDTGDATDTSDTRDTAEDTAADTSDDTAADTADTADTTDTRDTSETTEPLAIVINEVAAAGDPADWVELYNGGTRAVDLTGWLFRDSDAAHAYVFAAGTTLAAGDYLVIERDDTGVAGFNFGLGGADEALLYDVDQNLVDQTSWNDGQSPATRSWGRFPNGSGDFKTLINPTRGAANSDNPASVCGNGVLEALEACDGDLFGGLGCTTFGWGGGSLNCIESCTRVSQSGCTARTAGLVINEVESDETDRIELFNGGATQRSIGNYTLEDEGGGSYTIPSGTILQAGAYIVFEKDVNHTFGLGDTDVVTLKDGEGVIVDAIGWRSGFAIPSWCRVPNGTGGFRTCDEQSFGNENF